ncbi:MAG: response regulator transcription factor [Egibacteraceae bacterium]
MEPIKVLIADAQLLFADALALALGWSPDLALVEERPQTALAVIQVVAVHRPEVALVDFWLPDMEGPVLVRELHERVPDTKVIHLAWFHGPQQAQASLDAGATGFLPKSITVERLAEGIRRAHVGEHPVFGEQLDRLMQTIAARAEFVALVGERFARLTPRELEVLQLLAGGLTMVDIAAKLDVKQNTARTHVQNLLHKTGARSQLELVVLARDQGLVP